MGGFFAGACYQLAGANEAIIPVHWFDVLVSVIEYVPAGVIALSLSDKAVPAILFCCRIILFAPAVNVPTEFTVAVIAHALFFVVVTV